MVYPHEKLLKEAEEAGVSKKNLPSELLNKIKEFDMKKNKLDEKENGLKSIGIAQLLNSWLEDTGKIVDGQVAGAENKDGQQTADGKTGADGQATATGAEGNKTDGQQTATTGADGKTGVDGQTTATGTENKDGQQTATGADGKTGTDGQTTATGADENKADGQQTASADGKTGTDGQTATTDGNKADGQQTATPPAKKRKWVPLMGWVDL